MHAIPLLVSLLIEGKFGDSEGAYHLLSRDTVREHTTDEACCEAKRMAMRTALYAKYMAQLPPRVVQTRSQKPELSDDTNEWFCNFTQIKQFHYVFDAGYSRAEENDQVGHNLAEFI
jgi:hypothetical protein